MVYVAILLLSAFLGIAPELSIFSNLERFNGIENQIYLFLYLYLASRLLDRPLWRDVIFTSLMLIALLINIDTLVNHGTDIATGYGSLFGSKNYLAGFNFSVFIISVFLYLNHREQIWVKVSLAIGVLALFVALITFTRAPLLGFFLAFAIWLIRFGYTSWRHQKWFISAMLIMGLMGIGFVLKFSDHLLRPHNLRSRLDMWQISLQGFQESPFIGVGPENFGYLFDKYHPGQYALQDEQWIDNAHNILFNTRSESGLLGITAFFIMVFILFQYAFRKAKQQPVYQVMLLTLIMIYIEQLFILNSISQNIPQILIITCFSKEIPTINMRCVKSKLLIKPIKLIFGLIIAFVVYKTILLETYRHYQFATIYRSLPKNLSATHDDLLEYFNHPPIRRTYLVQKMAVDLVKMEASAQTPKHSILNYKNLIVSELNKIIQSNPRHIRTQVIL